VRCAPPYMLRYRTRVRTCCGLVALAFGGFHRSIEKGVTCGIRRVVGSRGPLGVHARVSKNWRTMDNKRRPVTGEMRLMRETWRTATGAIRFDSTCLFLCADGKADGAQRGWRP